MAISNILHLKQAHLLAKKYWYLLLLLPLLAWGLWYSLGESNKAYSHQQIKSPQSAFVAVAKGKVDIEGGMIEVASRVGGTFRDIYAEEGDVVQAGQVLAVQEDDQEQIAVKTAEAAVAIAKATLERLKINRDIAQRELERIEPLVTMDAFSIKELDQARDDLRRIEVDIRSQQATILQTEARLDSEKFRLEQRTIRAPVAGRIIEAMARPGVGASSLNVSTAFILLPDAEKVVRVELDQSFVGKVNKGQAAVISPESAPQQSFEGTVIRVSEFFSTQNQNNQRPRNNNASASIDVVVSAGELPLLIGQPVVVRFSSEAKSDAASE